ncbi:MAG: GNAT family N-acetyltransferase [Deltaproteobacteria bacterium]
MQIERLSNIMWNDRLSLTASEGYLSSYSTDYGWLSDKNTGLFLPFYIRRRVLFSQLIFTDSIDSFVEGYAGSREEKLAFLQACVQHAKEKLKIDSINQPPTYAVFEIVPTGSIFVPFGSYRIDLSQSVEDLWKNVHSKHRNVIRKAEKSGVLVKSGIEYLNPAAELVSATLQRANLKSSFTRSLSEKLRGHITAYICEYNGELQGSGIFLFSRKSVLHLWAGSIPAPFSGAINYMVWKAIQDFKKMGISCYDFVGARINPVPGSKLEGIQRFKSRFGVSLYRGYLWKYPLSWKCRYFDILKRGYYKLKRRKNDDVIDQELKLQRK